MGFWTKEESQNSHEVNVKIDINLSVFEINRLVEYLDKARSKYYDPKAGLKIRDELVKYLPHTYRIAYKDIDSGDEFNVRSIEAFSKEQALEQFHSECGDVEIIGVNER